MTISPRFEPWTTLRQYAEAGERLELETFIEAIGPSEAFRALLRLDPAERELVLTTLSPAEAAEFMEEIPREHAADMIEQLTASDAATIVSEMESAEQADVLADMHAEDAEAILAEMSPAIAADARELIRYPRDVAGGLMVRSTWRIRKPPQCGMPWMDSAIGWRSGPKKARTSTLCPPREA